MRNDFSERRFSHARVNLPRAVIDDPELIWLNKDNTKQLDDVSKEDPPPCSLLLPAGWAGRLLSWTVATPLRWRPKRDNNYVSTASFKSRKLDSHKCMVI